MQLKATEAVNNFLTATLAAESRESASAAASGSNDESAALNHKIEELTKQLSKKEREAEDKIKALTAQLKEREAGYKVSFVQVQMHGDLTTRVRGMEGNSCL
jgi:hypothetical protein